MFEACPSCSGSVRRGQKFCGSCGFSIAADLDRQLQSAQERLDKAYQALEELNFGTARDLCFALQDPIDVRLASFASAADELVVKIGAAETEWKLRVKASELKAKAAMDARDYEAVIQILSDLPAILLTNETRGLLDQARLAVSESADLRSRLRKLLADKDYFGAARVLDQLLQWNADESELLTLAAKIGKVIIKASQSSFHSGQYAEALSRLDTVPHVVRASDDYLTQRTLIDNVVWLSDQVARSPYATPVLGRLVQRLGKLAPHDERVPKLIQQLATKVKTGSSDGRGLFSTWAGKPIGWIDAPIAIMGRPRQIDISEAPLIQQNPTRFCVALGLALQGLGEVKYANQFLAQRSKLGIKKLFGRKSETLTAWGIDAGASAVRAVRLERTGEQTRVAEVHWLPFDQPLCRVSVELQSSVLLRQKLDELASKIKTEEVPVWVNLSTRELIGRFLTLPPVAEKQLKKLLEQEMTTQFPLAIDQLSANSAVMGTGADGSPRAVLVAAKKQVVEQREKVFQEAGIKVTGIQADSLALHNYAAHEFADLFTNEERANATPSALCLLDVGASGATLHCATADAFWFRYIDGGGEDLTVKLATACNFTHEEAEKLRLNPAELDTLAVGMEAMELRMHQVGVRLGQAFTQASQFLGDMTLQNILCTGGTVLTHGWVRHALHVGTKR